MLSKSIVCDHEITQHMRYVILLCFSKQLFLLACFVVSKYVVLRKYAAIPMAYASSPIQIQASFYKQHFYGQRQAEIGKKLSKSYATP